MSESKRTEPNNNAIHRRDFLEGWGSGSRGKRHASAGVGCAGERAAAGGQQQLCGQADRAGVVPSNLPQRPGPPVSIDVHCHWAPELI